MARHRSGQAPSRQRLQPQEQPLTLAALLAVARRHQLPAPITEEVCAVIEDGKNPREAVQALLGRELRPEQD